MRVTWLRRLLHDRPALAALVLAAALVMRLALPPGMMLSSDHMVLTVTICADATHGPQTRDIAIPMAPGGSKQHDRQGKDGGACPFGSLSSGMIGADPLLLALAIAFVFAIGLLPTAALRLQPASKLRPPSRAPPIPA